MSVPERHIERIEASAFAGGRDKGQGLSLRWRLMLLVAAAMIPLIIFQLGHQYVDYQRELDATAERTLALARGMALQIEGELDVLITAVTTLAAANPLGADDLSTF